VTVIETAHFCFVWLNTSREMGRYMRRAHTFCVIGFQYMLYRETNHSCSLSIRAIVLKFSRHDLCINSLKTTLFLFLD